MTKDPEDRTLHSACLLPHSLSLLRWLLPALLLHGASKFLNWVKCSPVWLYSERLVFVKAPFGHFQNDCTYLLSYFLFCFVFEIGFIHMAQSSPELSM